MEHRQYRSSSPRYGPDSQVTFMPFVDGERLRGCASDFNAFEHLQESPFNSPKPGSSSCSPRFESSEMFFDPKDPVIALGSPGPQSWPLHSVSASPAVRHSDPGFIVKQATSAEEDRISSLQRGRGTRGTYLGLGNHTLLEGCFHCGCSCIIFFCVSNLISNVWGDILLHPCLPIHTCTC